ncbi:MAG: carboxylase, partial [Chloroflexi bacterium]|nr:carboxylase [Chloroflexota bacterium]
PIDPDVQKRVLHYMKRDSSIVTRRPADLLEPELDKARESIKDFTQDMGDILTVTLYPDSGLRFVRQKYGREHPSTK